MFVLKITLAELVSTLNDMASNLTRFVSADVGSIYLVNNIVWLTISLRKRVKFLFDVVAISERFV